MPLATRLLLGAAALLIAVACGAPARPATASPTPPAVSATATATPSPATSTATPTAAASPVLRIELTDVRTGERFTLGGLGAKTVIVQGMAVW